MTFAQQPPNPTQNWILNTISQTSEGVATIKIFAVSQLAVSVVILAMLAYIIVRFRDILDLVRLTKGYHHLVVVEKEEQTARQDKYQAKVLQRQEEVRQEVRQVVTEVMTGTVLPHPSTVTVPTSIPLPLPVVVVDTERRPGDPERRDPNRPDPARAVTQQSPGG